MKPFLKVRQTVSTIGKNQEMRKTIKGLGLRGPGSEVLVANTPSFRGMVKKVIHLLKVEEVAAPPVPAPGSASSNSTSSGNAPSARAKGAAKTSG